jgi:methylthioribose-1-phosphate isomerase
VNISGIHHRTIWATAEEAVRVIDQSRLPFEFRILELSTVEETARAISTMAVRGAPLIGATAAYGLAIAAGSDASDASLDAAERMLAGTRPTAYNLAWALRRMRRVLAELAVSERRQAAFAEAARICEEDVEHCRRIGSHGLEVIRRLAGESPVQILTHCNAGWLACVDWGTALAPVYMAHDRGIAVHVWVDETRPRNQGALLTAYELAAHGVPHTVIADNVGGHLMQRGLVDLVLVGSDRTTSTGDVCNKIGTYLKALAAHDNGVPFYAALPTSSIDWSLDDGRAIPIEQRAAAELTHMTGRTAAGRLETVRVVPEGSPVANYAFDVTPARLVTGLITERGICAASAEGLLTLYPEKRPTECPTS